MIVPAAILLINLVVAREVRRAANSASNLGRQSTAYKSTVPTVMLLSTSFVYVLLSAPQCVFGVVQLWMSGASRCSEAWVVAHRNFAIAWAITQPIYAYNFFVYVVTGQRFRAELSQLFRCCRKTTIFSSARTTAAVTDDSVAHQRASAVTVSVIWLCMGVFCPCARRLAPFEGEKSNEKRTRSTAVAEIADRTFRLFNWTSLLYDIHYGHRLLLKKFGNLVVWSLGRCSGWKLKHNNVFLMELPIHLLGHFCCRAYRLATMHSVNDRLTWRTDRQRQRIIVDRSRECLRTTLNEM